MMLRLTYLSFNTYGRFLFRYSRLSSIDMRLGRRRVVLLGLRGTLAGQPSWLYLACHEAVEQS